MAGLLERSIIDEFSEKRQDIIDEGNEILKYIYTRIRMRKKPKSFEEILREYKTLRYAEGEDEIQLKGMPVDGRPQVTVIRTAKKDLINAFKRLSALFHLYKVLELGRVA